MIDSLRTRRFLTGVLSRHSDGGIAVRQLAALRPHVLALYALLCANAGALAFTHYTFAPAWLCVGVPGILVSVCLMRAVAWWRLRPWHISPAQAVDRLRTTTFLSIVLGVAFLIWAMELDSYGGPYEQGHVAIFVGITVIGCIFCLSHLPAAAFISAGIVMGLFLTRYFASGNSIFIAIAINIAFVAVVMVQVLSNNFLAFVQLVASQDEAQKLLEENAGLAHTDSLTGLPNRRYFFQRLSELIRFSSVEETTFALAIFDLDRFKPINDTYGHNIGDRVLAVTGQRLAAFAEPGVTVTRLGGDEFGLLIRSPGSPAEVVALCDRICEALHAPIRLSETVVATGCSGGLALYPAAGRTADALFDRADYALYHSKESQRGVTTLFSQEHEDAIRAERAVETALRGADLAAEMTVHYQPILDTHTNAVVLVEGLARWTNPKLGRVPPDRFVAAAERCGMINAMTLLLLGKALAEARRLPPEIGLSFNLSAQDLASPETVRAILTLVRESGFDPRRLTLELTETALMHDFNRAQEAITLLRGLGIAIALDDFGTGYSSLGYVHRLPLDKIKIDRSFMADVDSDLGRSVVATILHLCQNLGLDGITEGIETPEQLRAVRGYGCRYVQGYLIGRPMPMEVLLERLRAPEPEAMRLSA